MTSKEFMEKYFPEWKLSVAAVDDKNSPTSFYLTGGGSNTISIPLVAVKTENEAWDYFASHKAVRNRFIEINNAALIRFLIDRDGIESLVKLEAEIAAMEAEFDLDNDLETTLNEFDKEARTINVDVRDW